jgi:type II secretory pathway pseudopilin PulG
MLTRLRQRDDAGITLAELVVAMGITSLLMALGVVFFVNVVHSSDRTVVTNQVTADARVTLDSWTTMLRVADWLDSGQTDRFEEITPTKIVFWSDLNNRTTADVNPVIPQKIALMLRTTGSASTGQLIEVKFVPGDPSTVQSVRQVAFYAGPTAGSSGAIFQPYSMSGGDVDVVNTKGCMNGSTPTVGLCLPNPPGTAGMLDPTVAAGSLAVTSGPLRGDATLVSGTVVNALRFIGGIRIVFTVSDPAGTAAVNFVSAASVNSGWPAS